MQEDDINGSQNSDVDDAMEEENVGSTQGPQSFSLRVPRYRLEPQQVSMQSVRKDPPKYTGRRIQVLKPQGRDKTGHRTVPSASEEISNTLLSARIRRNLNWMRDDNFRNSFNTTYDILNEFASNSEPHRLLLNRLLDLGNRYNQMMDEGENILDEIGDTDLSYRQLRLTTVNASSSSKRFTEMSSELDVISAIISTWDTIFDANDWFSENAPDHSYEIEFMNLIPRFTTTQTLYQSLLSLINLTLEFTFRVLDDVRNIRGRIQVAQDFELRNSYVETCDGDEKRLIRLLDSIGGLASIVNRPAIREDRNGLLRNIQGVLNFIRRVYGIRLDVFDLNDDAEQEEIPLPPFKSATLDDIQDTERRRSEHYDWNQRAQRVIRELTSSSTTEDASRRQIFGTRGIPQISDAIIPMYGSFPRRTTADYLDTPVPSPQPQEINDPFPVVQPSTSDSISSPQLQQNWRTIPGGAAGHSTASAAPSKPPDDEDQASSSSSSPEKEPDEQDQ